MGRHLIALGQTPGRHFKDLLEVCLEAQLDGVFADLDGGVEFARGLLAPHPPDPPLPPTPHTRPGEGGDSR